MAYAMLDLRKRQQAPDIKKYIFNLEQWIIETLAVFGVCGERRSGRVGIWLDLTRYGQRQQDAKIAAIGVRVRHWVTYHGISINVNPDLSHFEGIVPCGIADAGVTSLKALGLDVSLADVDSALKEQAQKLFS